MNDLFKITYFCEERGTPFHFDMEDYADVSPLYLCMERFLSAYQGEFVLKIGDIDLTFEFRPDLSTIFDELPNALETLTSETASPVELYFFEQGTDLTLWIERHLDIISLSFEKGPAVGKRFTDLTEERFSVPSHVFLSEWIRFAQSVLELLSNFQPDIANDESYQEYRNRLMSLAP